MSIVWTRQACRRLLEIHDFIAADSPSAAQRLVDRLRAKAEDLPRFPGGGRIVPELRGADVRELIIGHYRMVYRVRGENIEILTVFEGHRLFPAGDDPEGCG